MSNEILPWEESTAATALVESVHTAQFLMAHGAKDTKKYTGDEYPTITWAQICKMARQPSTTNKEDAVFIIPSTYVGSDGRTHDVQRQNGVYWLLCVDIDTGNLSFREVDDAVKATVGDVQYLIYSSSGAKPDNRKWRVMIALQSEVEGADYEWVQTILFERFLKAGVSCDGSLARPGQPAYLPNVPADQRDADGQPIFYMHKLNKSDVFADVFALGITEEVEARKGALAQAEAIAARERRQRLEIRATNPGSEITPVEYFNNHYSIKDMLDRYGYKEGAKSQFKSPQASNYSTKLFDDHWVSMSWSDVDACIGNAKGVGDARIAWGDAFDLYVAYEHGGNYDNAVREYGREIRLEVARQREEARISGSPFEAVTGEAAPAELVEVKPEQNHGFTFLDWYYVTTDEVFRNIKTGVENSKSAFDLAYTRFAPTYEDENGKVRQYAASKYVASELYQVVERSIYMPTQGATFYIGNRNPIQCCNRYIEANIPLVPDDWKQHSAWRLLERHLMQLLPKDFDLVLQWMAHNVQYPGKKILWAPLIKGVEGDGKSTLAYALISVMGEENVNIINPDEIVKSFTGWSDNGAVGVIEEIKIPNARKQEVMNKLKPVITNSFISVERKGKDSYKAPNCCNYMALTNHEDAIAIDHRDRRWAVLFTPYDSREQVDEVMGAKYFKELYAAINEHPGVIRGWLLNASLDGFNPMQAPPMTQAKKQVIESSKSDAQIAVEEMLRLRPVGVAHEAISMSHLNDSLKVHNERTINTSYASKVMSEMGYLRFETDIKWDGSARRVYVSKAFYSKIKNRPIVDQRDAVRKVLDRSLRPGEGRGRFNE